MEPTFEALVHTVEAQYENKCDFRKGASCFCDFVIFAVFRYPLSGRTEGVYEADEDVRGVMGGSSRPSLFLSQTFRLSKACFHPAAQPCTRSSTLGSCTVDSSLTLLIPCLARPWHNDAQVHLWASWHLQQAPKSNCRKGLGNLFPAWAPESIERRCWLS